MRFIGWQVVDTPKLLGEAVYEDLQSLYRNGKVYIPLEDNGAVYFSEFLYALVTSLGGFYQQMYLKEVTKL